MYGFFPYKWYFGDVRCHQKPARAEYDLYGRWGAPRLQAAALSSIAFGAAFSPSGIPFPSAHPPTRRLPSDECANAHPHACGHENAVPYSVTALRPQAPHAFRRRCFPPLRGSPSRWSRSPRHAGSEHGVGIERVSKVTRGCCPFFEKTGREETFNMPPAGKLQI